MSILYRRIINFTSTNLCGMIWPQYRKKLFPMTNTKTKTSPAKVIAAVVIAVILAFTLVCLLTGNINPVCRVTAMLMPVWLAAELRLLCTLL